MLGYDRAVALAVYAPNGVVHPLAVEDEAGVLREEFDNVELAPRELYRRAVIGDGAVGVIHGERAVEAHLARGHVALFAPEMRVHSRGELAGGEGLHDIVVRPGGEAAELVALLDAGGEEDNGAGDVRAYRAADLEPVYVGHSDVEQYEVGLHPGGADGIRARIGRDDLVAALAEEAREHIGDVALVVGYQQALSHLHSPPCVFSPRAGRVRRRCGGR